VMERAHIPSIFVMDGKSTGSGLPGKKPIRQQSIEEEKPMTTEHMHGKGKDNSSKENHNKQS